MEPLRGTPEEAAKDLIRRCVSEWGRPMTPQELEAFADHFEQTARELRRRPSG